ncbi:MAG TPA: hypothetical protein VF570_17935 [Pyrinomonadaceae bacterium]
MQKPFAAPALLCAALLTSCGGANPPSNTSARNSNATANGAQTSIQHGPSTQNPGIAPSHGGAAVGANPSAPSAPTTAPVATPEFDAKIQKAEARAKAAGAGDADKKAAAAAYFERADFFRDAGDPKLYRFALRDYRIGLRYDPGAKEPRARMDEIVKIYQMMGRPVPELGNEP